MLSNFSIISVFREKNRVKLALAIPTRALATLVNEITNTQPLFATKTVKTLSVYTKAATYLLNVLLHNFP